MNIHGIRLGHATNSSSSHSIVLLPDAQKLDSGGGYDKYQFGWEKFILSKPDSKLRYFAILLRDNLWRYMNKETANVVVSSLLNVELDENCYIDHESFIGFPEARDEKGPDWKFAWAFKAFLEHESVVILGGSNNEDDWRPAGITEINMPLPHRGDWIVIARYDQEYQYWTLYNRSTGAKIRFSFDDLLTDGKRRDVDKASAPELVDLCITKYCPYRCGYCYQDSTEQRKHSDYAEWVLYPLKELGVFEVALGGGEPTLHPKFAQILESCHHLGITPNFSTRNIGWFHDPRNREHLAYIGGVGFSVHTFDDVKEVRRVVNLYGIDPRQISIQVVDGTMESWWFSSVLTLCATECFGATILGFKNLGRGHGFERINMQWIETIKDRRERHLGLPRISIDTALANEYQEQLGSLNISPTLYRVREGEFSMYIDAVDNNVGRSSYEPETFLSFNDKRELTTALITNAFTQWQ